MQRTNPNITIISGHTRSGKSLWAEKLVSEFNHVSYLATYQCNPSDKEMLDRITKHRLRRPSHWSTVESRGDLLTDLRSIETSNSILVDSLGGYVASNLTLNESQWSKQASAVINHIKGITQNIFLVKEETGWGIIPENKISRVFNDRLGSLGQDIEKISSNSWLVIQGRAIDLKRLSIEI